ncbi:hypothetical protein [Xanthomonas vasicola]|uniref:hypothetical protein n=2 Tax=Xanthomonas vasicola TaxID=56459 RepID=UPI0012D33EC5|nr:hypothetical protein [Xanthomonas vasicola]
MEPTARIAESGICCNQQPRHCRNAVHLSNCVTENPMPAPGIGFFVSIHQQRLDLGELFNFSELSTFTQNIPVEWITSALDLERERSTARDLLARPSHFTQLMKAPGQS